MTESLANRVKRVIKDARISPRILASVTELHYTTIYAIIREDSPSYRTTENIVTGTLDKIEQLIKDKKLPFDSKTLHKDRADQLKELLSVEVAH